jgi:E3 ubiquitin-protein ligase DOA10
MCQSAKSLPVCRICLSDQEEDLEKNPFISPCKCSGSMGLVHVSCIRMWIDSKRETRSTDSTDSYQWTIIRCEMCHFPFPMYHQLNLKKSFKLFNYEDPPANCEYSYIIFETVY